MSEENISNVSAEEVAPAEESRSKQVQKHLRPEDKKWLYGVITGVLLTVVSVITVLVSLFWGWNVVSWCALGGFVLGIALMIGFSMYGVKYLQDRGLDVAQIGYNSINKTNDDIKRKPQTIEEADRLERETNG